MARGVGGIGPAPIEPHLDALRKEVSPLPAGAPG